MWLFQLWGQKTYELAFYSHIQEEEELGNFWKFSVYWFGFALFNTTFHFFQQLVASSCSLGNFW
jgi:hypothetical protein